MLMLKAVCHEAVADEVVAVLCDTPGAGRISHNRATEANDGLDIVETEIPNASADRLMARLATLDGWDGGEITLTAVGDVERFVFTDGRATSAGPLDEGLGIEPARVMLRRLVQVDYPYVLLMMMAALIAAVGLVADLPVAIIGAMAFSPDLGRLNAMGFALLIGDFHLLWRGTRSLAIGMVIAVVLAAAGTLLLEAVGATDDPLNDIPDRLRDFVSTLDGFTITVAVAAGIAAMVVFMNEHGRAAVGVGVSLTTIPAAAYIGIALAEGAWAEAGNGATVLLVNIVCVVGAEVAVGAAFRKHLNRRVERFYGSGPGILDTD
jgi:uncharacterized hydrophobic protein (TIGR00271 family)